MSDSTTSQIPLALLIWLYLRYWAWKALTFCVLGPIYTTIIADAERILIPALGIRLYKLPIPGFSIFGQYVETRRLDLAMIMAVCLLVTVWSLWEMILKVFLSTEESFRRYGWNAAAYKRIVLTLGTLILGADVSLFYMGAAQVGWGDAGFSMSAFLAAAAYLAVTVFVSLVSVTLRRPLDGR